jgi:pyroglutamyl-peptidase
MSNNLVKSKIPHHISNTAGTYVCNLIFYKALALIEEKSLNTKAGFIHVPPTKEMATTSRLDIKGLGKELSILLNSLV